MGGSNIVDVYREYYQFPPVSYLGKAIDPGSLYKHPFQRKIHN